MTSNSEETNRTILCELCDDACTTKHVDHGNLVITNNSVHTCTTCGTNYHWLCNLKSSLLDPVTKMETKVVVCGVCKSLTEKEDGCDMEVGTAFVYDSRELIGSIQKHEFGSPGYSREIVNFMNYLENNIDEYNKYTTYKSKQVLHDLALCLSMNFDSYLTPHFIHILDLKPNTFHHE